MIFADSSDFFEDFGDVCRIWRLSPLIKLTRTPPEPKTDSTNWHWQSISGPSAFHPTLAGRVRARSKTDPAQPWTALTHSLSLSLYLSLVVSPHCRTLSSPLLSSQSSPLHSLSVSPHRHSQSLSLSLPLLSPHLHSHTLSQSSLLVSCCGYLGLTFWEGSITSWTSLCTLSLSVVRSFTSFSLCSYIILWYFWVLLISCISYPRLVSSLEDW